MNKPYVKQTIENEISYIEFFHPIHNSLPSKMLKELVQAIHEAGCNDEVKVIVLKSGGERTFCAGASFEDMIQIKNKEQGTKFFSGFANVINAMRTCPKLIIGRIQGKTVGGGVGLIACTDYCMATKYAAIKLSELHIGIGPFVISPAIERKIGITAMSQLALNSTTFFSAHWAEQKGLFSSIHSSTEELDRAVKKMGELLSTYHQESVAEMKKVFWKGTENWDVLLTKQAEISGRLVLSEFTKTKLKEFDKK